MAVLMNRSTNMAPESLSTSYFTGSLCEGISMITLMSLGTSRPEFTLSRLMAFFSSAPKKGGKYSMRRRGREPAIRRARAALLHSAHEPSLRKKRCCGRRGRHPAARAFAGRRHYLRHAARHGTVADGMVRVDGGAGADSV